MRAVTQLLGSFVLGAAVWASWLWETGDYRNDGATFHGGPYTEVQVVGCALTYVLLAAALSTRLHPVLVTVGLAGGFWIAWTLQAATTDETGLFLVGAVLLGLGLLVGGAIGSGSGYLARLLWQRLRSPEQRA